MRYAINLHTVIRVAVLGQSPALSCGILIPINHRMSRSGRHGGLWPKESCTATGCARVAAAVGRRPSCGTRPPFVPDIRYLSLYRC